MTTADFHLLDGGSVFILTPLTEVATEWCDEHLPEDAMRWGANGYAVEHRYIEPIVTGIVADGLEVRT